MKILDYIKMLFTNPNSPEGYKIRAQRLREMTCICGHMKGNHIDNTCVIGCKCNKFNNCL